MIFLGILLLVVGFILLIKGADWFVDGAAGVAAKLRSPQLVIGLTIVAVGTSAPELATSLSAAAQEKVGFAIGNVLGSNICNILLILGLSAMMSALPVQRDSLRIDFPMLLLASVLIVFFGYTDNEIARWEGGIMALLLVAYTTFLVWNALRKRKKEGTMSALNEHEVLSEGDDGKKSKFAVWYDTMKEKFWFLLIVTVVGLGVVVGGSMIAVEGAKMIGKELKIPDNIMGLTVVAIGTSLPELITSVVAAKKGETDIAIGNIIGSNLFNILLVAGLSAVIFPLPYISLSGDFTIDGYIALGVAALLALFAYLPGHKLRKWQGWVLFLGAIAYYVYCVLSVVL